MSKHRRSLVDRRIRFLLALLVLLFAATLGRAVWLQGVHAAPLAKLATTQHRETITIPASRGAIYDRSGVQLALGERAVTVYADPRTMRDPRRAAAAAAETLGVDAEKLLPALADRKRRFVYVQRKAAADAAGSLERRGIVGLGFYTEERRRYPQRGVAAQVLGFAGLDNVGLSGLELALDRILAGKPGRKTIVKDPFGRAIETVSAVDERPGRDVFLTLDHVIQAHAEAVLRQTVAKWKARAATAVVLDPRNGDVLAMAVAPGYDANRAAEVARSRQRNLAVTDTYEPGSTFKLVTVAGALSERLVTALSTYPLPPSIRGADRVIPAAHDRGTERMTVAQILSRSSNVGTITLAHRLGAERLARWVDRFGFGRTTGLDFPGESPGIVLPLSQWSGSTIGTLPMGHGIAVTPLQMAAAYGTVANGGLWVQPHLVDRIAGGPRVKPKTRRILAPRVARQLGGMLQGVVAEDGTGEAAAIAGYRVAGKTGTAAKPEKGRYSSRRYVASFVGFVPATKPRLVILVTVDEPSTIWGGVVAAPAFQQIARFALQYLEVPPDAPVTAPPG